MNFLLHRWPDRLLLPSGVDAAARSVLLARALRAFADGGVAVLLPAYLLALGLDTRVLARLSTAQTFAFEHRLAQLLGMEEEELNTRTGGTLPVEGELPALDGAGLWLNSPPLSREQLAALKSGKRYYLSMRPGVIGTSGIADANDANASEYKIYAMAWSHATDLLLVWDALSGLLEEGELWRPTTRVFNLKKGKHSATESATGD